MPGSYGPFSNIPAPGDPIRSAWADQLTRYAVDQVAAGKPQAYSGRRSTDDVTPTGTFGTVASINLGGASAGVWLVTGTAIVSSAANDIVIARLQGGGADIGPWVSNWDIIAGKKTPLTICEQLTIPTTTGAYVFTMQAYGYGSQIQLCAGSRIVAAFIGPP